MLKLFLDLFLKQNCPLCGTVAEDRLCYYCQQKLADCQLEGDFFWLEEGFFLFSWGKYDGHLRRCITLLKYNGRRELGELFGQWLGEKWIVCNHQRRYKQLIVVPIPIHEQKLKTRGYNQAELVAQGFCKITGYTLQPHLLLRVKNTKAMFGLKPTERQENIRQAFQLAKDYKRKINPNTPILIMDDIYTTGTTVREAKAVLAKGKLKTVGVATLSLSSHS
ncbi:MAG: ComF family protein [Geminocystis sp.]|nr:ComF family protein [Geminocystis sp.]MCS7148394.1 ComF family protein [Geminocystis sp.]MCX8078291.1 ComF family protein [Geminocystis sp.]MDW8463641.1 ComF family protein [Geminocystis sp.]HIK38880.1 ComF family protein [Geminocystis sp. M7585_C2015_104]